MAQLNAMLKTRMPHAMPSAALSSGVTAHTHHEAPGSKMLNSPARGKRLVRRNSGCRGMLAGQDISGLLFSISPQKRHFTASALISSAQNGHFIVSFSIIAFSFCLAGFVGRSSNQLPDSIATSKQYLIFIYLI